MRACTVDGMLYLVRNVVAESGVKYSDAPAAKEIPNGKEYF